VVAPDRDRPPVPGAARAGHAAGPPTDEQLRQMFDTSVPNVARAYDYLLGGKDNYAADRRLAQRIVELIPDAVQSCRLNREFLVRVVGHLARQGIGQFLDIGSGLPTHPNVHDVVQSVRPDARVVYVDNDHVVAAHARALLMGGAGVSAIDGDLRQPEDIVTSARELIDFREPAAVLMFAVLHFITDAEQPAKLIAAFNDAVVPGSCLAISHITDDQVSPVVSREAQAVYRDASAPAVPRSRSEIGQFFAGFSLLGPGVVDINDWPAQGQPPEIGKRPAATLFYGGVGVKDSPLPRREPDRRTSVARV
jgi:S-adenosyl methyltransferase